MTEKTMKNSYVVSILSSMNDSDGKALQSKRLPIKLLYALRRSLPEVEAAYKAYYTALTDICNRYGATPDRTTAEDPEQQAALSAEVVELLNTETTVRVHTVAPEVLDTCGVGGLDPLTYREVDRLWWLIEEDSDGD